MKFFSLLFGKDIHPSTGEKIIPAKEFTTLHKANDILKTVKQEALAYRKKITEECEIQKEQAYQEGFAQGLEKFNELLLHMNKMMKTLEKELQKKILPVTLMAAKKILGEELKLHPDRIVDIVLQALKPVISHHRIKIYANKADLDILEANKPKIRSILEQLESLTLLERDDIEPGGCIIETESGIINAQLEKQWRALESAFQSFMKK